LAQEARILMLLTPLCVSVNPSERSYISRMFLTTSLGTELQF